MRQMLEAGVHFGHQARYWNPKMAPYIFGIRSKIHIINLEKTLPLFNDAINFLGRLAARKGTVLMVGTKRAAQDIIKQEAQRCEMPFVNKRWLGGMLTNYRTIKQSVKRLKELEEMAQDNSLERFSKKETLSLTRELEKLEASLGGIKNMNGLPDALFIIDVGYEKNAVAEARKLGIPVIGVVDTNNDPEGVDYIIPGNDDAIRALQIYVSTAADAIVEGRIAANVRASDSSDEFIELDDTGTAETKKKAAAAESSTAQKVKVKRKAKAGGDKSETHVAAPGQVQEAAAVAAPDDDNAAENFPAVDDSDDDQSARLAGGAQGGD